MLVGDRRTGSGSGRGGWLCRRGSTLLCFLLRNFHLQDLITEKEVFGMMWLHACSHMHEAVPAGHSELLALDGWERSCLFPA